LHGVLLDPMLLADVLENWSTSSRGLGEWRNDCMAAHILLSIALSQTRLRRSMPPT
jgi:hypothetical protein